jgi:hypothetical protein
MAKPYNDRKFGLGEPLASMVKDFCAANYGVDVLNLVRAVLKEHIEQRLNNEPAMRERYEKARRERLALPNKVVSLASKTSGEK